MDWYIVHQVSQVHTRLITERLGIDPERAPLTFPKFGNVGPAAIPLTLAKSADRFRWVTACSAWASDRGSTRASPKSSGDRRANHGRRHAGAAGPGDLAAMAARSLLVTPHRRRQPRRRPPPLARARHRHARRPTRMHPTLLCVHGNPTWGYAWASFLRRMHHDYRVVAVDQLGMGYSERTATRRYSDRVRDLDDVVVALQIPSGSPLVVAAHDWGGAIAMGWAVQDPHQIAGMILCNTGIAVPEGRSAPGIIRLAASPLLLDVVCRGTPTFVEGTVRLSGRRISKLDREAFRAPYRSAPARAAIADFVGDIPLQAGHPSEKALAEVASRLGAVKAPVLLAWGARDPVFNDDFAADLAGRFPNITMHRFAKANHLVMAEADVAEVAETWLADLFAGRLAERTLGPESGRREHGSAAVVGDRCATRRCDDSVRRPGNGRQRHVRATGATHRRRRQRTASSGPRTRRPRRHAHAARHRSRGSRLRRLAGRRRDRDRRPWIGARRVGSSGAIDAPAVRDRAPPGTHRRRGVALGAPGHPTRHRRPGERRGRRHAAGPAGRRARCGAVHLRGDRSGEGRPVPPRTTRRPARRARRHVRDHRRRPARRRLRALRALRPGARHPDGASRRRRHQARPTHRRGARRRVPSHRRNAGLRLAGCAGQRHGLGARRGRSSWSRRAPHRLLCRSAGAIGDTASGGRSSRRTPRCTRRTA